MRKPRYLPVKNGVWFRAPTWIACCDCGLVHRIEFRRAGRRLLIRVQRDNRRTGQTRRWKLKAGAHRARPDEGIRRCKTIRKSSPTR